MTGSVFRDTRAREAGIYAKRRVKHRGAVDWAIGETAVRRDGVAGGRLDSGELI